VAEVSQLLESAAAGKAPAVVLFEGDEYLARTSARELADAIVPEKDRPLNLLVLDAAAGAREIVSHLMTVAMFAAPKAVVVEGADAFSAEVDAEREIARVRDLWQGKRQRDAARRLLKLVRPAGWGAAEVAFGTKTGSSAARWRKEVGAAPDEGDKSWLQDLSALALAQQIAPPPDDLELLVRALTRGLPPKTHLILVAESLPPRHALVRLAEEKGACVRRRAERRGRTIDTLDISPLVADELGPLKKKLARDAELELKNRLGDDLRLIASELRKLALHAGDRAQITREDVEALVAPVREEEFFALAEAVGEGDTAKALQLFGDELRRKANASAVALPFLGGVASAVRKALADSARYAGAGPRELGYNEYQAKLFPALETELSAKKQKVPHPFAAWLGYKRSRRRPRAFWRRALIRCGEVDFELKNGADPRLSMERLLVEVCARARPPEAA
jgi:DNA polymerase III delta subunit